ncbi:MAG: hypothetical protein L0Z62_50710 [Gemmataceae bacterium]|nr:hypothetical protein [Gemmataceae bacterium]
MSADTRWEDARRVEGWAGEVRVNVVRLAALLVFYGHHLVNFGLIGDETVTPAYHAAVTALVLAWAAAILVLHLCLSRRYVPPALKYLATSWDLGMITGLLVLGDDPRSMLAVLYFLVISGAALRLSLALVWAATLGAMGAYAFFLGYVHFWLDPPAHYRLERSGQIIFLLALGAAGILAGQLVRQVRRIARGHLVTVVAGENTSAPVSSSSTQR